jgi:TatA/E family protein of Tat protein translocase
MFGLGWMEIGLIGVIALMVFGPKKLPELARKLGEGIREFKSASESFRSTVTDEVSKTPTPTASQAQPQYDDHEGPVPPAQLQDGQDGQEAELVEPASEDKEPAEAKAES